MMHLASFFDLLGDGRSGYGGRKGQYLESAGAPGLGSLPQPMIAHRRPLSRSAASVSCIAARIAQAFMQYRLVGATTCRLKASVKQTRRR